MKTTSISHFKFYKSYFTYSKLKKKLFDLYTNFCDTQHDYLINILNLSFHVYNTYFIYIDK